MRKGSLRFLILENAHIITKLKNNITESYKNKSNDLAAWQKACELFHSSYDQLAFPGGLEKGIIALRKHEQTTINTAIEYLLADPHHFRSGYNKKEIIHLLKNIPLTKNQINKLQQFLLQSLKSKYHIYMEYYRLATKIQSPEFKKQLENLIAQSSDKREVNRAKRMIQAINLHSKNKLKKNPCL